MGLFSKKNKKDTEALSQRYSDNPVYILFENFVLDTIGEIPAEKAAQLEAMDLAKVFNTEAKTWQLVIKQVLNLSDTIEIAILDLWYTNQEIARQKGILFSPNQFAIEFVDNYNKEDSMIDVWEGDSLAKARNRILLKNQQSS